MHSSRTPHSAVWLFVLAALVVLFYRQSVFTNLIFARGDTLLYFYPYWDYRAQALLDGRLPLWNPYLFMGAPFLANSQAGVFYPLNWPLVVFAAPVAVKISIVVHVLIAAWGTFALARRIFQLEPYPAAFAAIVFALGGYLGAQVEHVNQLQGLAWLPWALLVTCQLVSLPYRKTRPTIHLAALSVLVALQLTAGHTQTTFITLVACGLAAIFQLLIPNNSLTHSPYSSPRSVLAGLALFVSSILLALALAAVQLVPTVELSRLSLRGGGLPLNEAISFSLNPLLVGRALLPGYSRMIFSEFVAYPGMVPLLLAALAVQSLITNNRLRLTRLSALKSVLASPAAPALLLAGLGLFFAFGGYNPLYLLLARFVPGFNFFRVPARWLVLWALGAAGLAGSGLQQILSDTHDDTGSRKSDSRSFSRFAPYFVLPLALIALTPVSAGITPPGETGPMGGPEAYDILAWLIPLFLAGIGLLYFSRRVVRAGVVGLAILELFWASIRLPLNNLTTPDAYSSIRPAMTQLLAHQAPAATNPFPPARFLSLSALEFDPGDLAELRSQWDPQLPPGAVYDAVVATKHKEVLSPNLPLTWRVPSVDGYDGGILPLRAYAGFARQFGEVPANTDGRLRQFLTAIPPNWLLNLTNTRWIITDKTGDAWVGDVFYDLGLAATATAASPLTLDRIPDFQATGLGLVLGDDSQSGVAQIMLEDGETVTAPLTFDPSQPAIRLRWRRPAAVKQIVILTPTVLTLRGASLVDERTDSFRSLTLGPYRLAHSGDVKIYENLNVLPRAFLTSNNPLTTPGDPSAGELADFRPATVVKYEAEHVVVETHSDTPGYLILTDAHYPGWLATVEGQPAELLTVYGLFRALALTPGAHTVEFRFDPPSLKLGAALSALGLMVLALLLVISLPRSHKPQ